MTLVRLADTLFSIFHTKIEATIRLHLRNMNQKNQGLRRLDEHIGP